MSRTCTVCGHPERAAIDTALLAGVPLRNIAGQHGLSPASVQRHKQDHIPPPLAAEHRETQQAYALDVLAQLRAINAASIAVLREARQSGDGELVLKAVDRVQRQVELQAKLLGELDERPQVNVLVLPEWVTLRARLLLALAPYPAARQALVAALDA